MNSSKHRSDIPRRCSSARSNWRKCTRWLSGTASRGAAARVPSLARATARLKRPRHVPSSLVEPDAALASRSSSALVKRRSHRPRQSCSSLATARSAREHELTAHTSRQCSHSRTLRWHSSGRLSSDMPSTRATPGFRAFRQTRRGAGDEAASLLIKKTARHCQNVPVSTVSILSWHCSTGLARFDIFRD